MSFVAFSPMFIKQFLGKTAAIAFAAIVAVHAVAIPLQHHNTPSLMALGAVFAVTLALSSRSLLTGMCIAFAEIMVGGHGHLLAASVGGFSVSVRMTIFAAVMLAWLWHVVRHQAYPKFLVFRDTPFLLLAAAVAIGTVQGFIMNDPAKAFDDMNSYVTLAYLLPMLSIVWDNEKKRQLLQILFASVMWVCLSTLCIVFLFTHLPGPVLRGVYEFVRDARLAEVTLLTGPSWFVGNFLPLSSPWYFRVFEPAHFFPIVMAFLIIAARFMLWRSERMPTIARVALLLCVATFIASLSRSFLVGAFVGLLVTGLFILLEAPKAVWKTAAHTLQLGFLVLLGAGIFWATIVFPFPQQPDLRDAAFYRASTADDRGLAVSSRWNLLYPMFTAIMENPMMGEGFGREVTFVSDDPRVREFNPSGEWTTYRFEWGYQDIWLKMGLLGLIAFVWYIVVLSRTFYYSYYAHGHRWLVLGLYAGVIALFATHIFSPYLNHPIGLGFMVFVLPFFDWQGTVAAYDRKTESVPKESLTKLPTPVTSRNQ